MNEEKLRKIMVKRFFSGLINFFLFFIFYFILGEVLIFYSFNIVMEFNNYFFLINVFIYFIMVPIITKGYTLGSALFGIRMVNIDGSKIYNPFLLALRTLISIFLAVYTVIFTHVKINSSGQLFYDKLFNTTMVDNKVNLKIEIKPEWYIFNSWEDITDIIIPAIFILFMGIFIFGFILSIL